MGRKQIPDLHLMPVNDSMKHEDSPLCLCKPEAYGNDMDADLTEFPAFWYLHNALDGREDRTIREAVTGWIVVGPAYMGELHSSPLGFPEPSQT